MSASLVGSEMCIRDSAETSLKMTSAWLLPCWLKGLTSRGKEGTHSSIAPVSYTHLTLPTICSV
eukprot:2590493-Alexandrium_andersonii.AAC.1